MPEKCVIPERHCPWGPEEWKRFGEAMGTIKRTSQDVSDIKVRLNTMSIPSYRKTAMTSGGVGATIAGVVIGLFKYFER